MSCVQVAHAITVSQYHLYIDDNWNFEIITGIIGIILYECMYDCLSVYLLAYNSETAATIASKFSG